MGCVQRCHRDVGGSDVVAPVGELLGQHADRAARFERVPVPRIGQQCQGDRVFAPFVPSRLQLPGIGRLGVHAVEVGVGQPSGQRNTTSPTASSRRNTAAGITGGASAVAGSNWLRNACAATRLRASRRGSAALRRRGATAPPSHPGMPSATSTPGTPAAPPPVRPAATAAARPTASWSGWPSPRQVAAHHVPAGRAARISVNMSASSVLVVADLPVGQAQ